MKPRTNVWIPLAMGLLMLAVAFVISVPSAEAQCGSQASSCKNCHEVQGQMPVNDKGDWHVSHAFGDFCEFCHAGNVQAIEIDAAHTGMVAPLEDAQVSCGSCHPSNLMEMAEVYAIALGVEVGSRGMSESTTDDSSGGETATSESASVDAFAPGLVVGSGEVIDYNQQYDETVCGCRTVNWGDVIASVLIVLVAVGGGGFVLWNEGWVSITMDAETFTPPPEYPSNVVAILPQIMKLDPDSYGALKRLLKKPQKAADLLQIFSRLDSNDE